MSIFPTKKQMYDNGLQATLANARLEDAMKPAMPYCRQIPALFHTAELSKTVHTPVEKCFILTKPLLISDRTYFATCVKKDLMGSLLVLLLLKPVSACHT